MRFVSAALKGCQICSDDSQRHQEAAGERQWGGATGRCLLGGGVWRGMIDKRDSQPVEHMASVGMVFWLGAVMIIRKVCRHPS